MAFHDVRLPLRLSFGALGGPERRTEIVTLAPGFEERNSPWARSRRRYNLGAALSTLADLHGLIAFFEARHGRLHGFRFRDPVDHASAAPGSAVSPLDQALGEGDGTATTFALHKTYSSGASSYARRIDKPVEGTVRVAVAGAEQTIGTMVTVDAVLGTITFLPGHIPAAGAAVTAGFEFDVPVRFDTDHLEINLAAFEAGEAPSVPLIEIRVS